MRVASKMVFDAAKYHLGSITENLSEANETVATGKRINDLSDDPVGLTQVLGIRSDLSNIEQMGRNITRGTSWLAASEGALSQVQNIISDVKSLCIQMSNATTSPDQRTSAAESVQNMMEEVISLANTEVGGSYIFSGSKTDTTSFSQDGTYDGDDNPFAIKIGKDSTVEVGSDGSVVFGDIFDEFNSLVSALQNNEIGGIQDAIDNFDDRINDISVKISDIGSKMLRMEIKENIYQDLDISNTERLSNIEDADIASAIMNLSAIQFAYQAALASSSKTMTLSLVNYME